MYSVTPALKRRGIHLGARDRFRLRQLAVAPLLHREEGVRAGELSLHDRDLLAPRVRDELDVFQVPVVILDADAGRPGLRPRLASTPGREVVGRPSRLLDIRREPCRGAAQLYREILQIGALLPDALRPEGPQVSSVAVQVCPCLREKTPGPPGCRRRSSRRSPESAETGRTRALRRRPGQTALRGAG